MSELIVYSYGVAEFTYYVFNAVAAIVNDKSFDIILKTTYLLAGLVAAFNYSQTRHWSVMASSLLRYSLITAILLIPKVTVTIHDDVVQYNEGVQNVPLGLALPASFVTTAFHAFNTLMETAFHWSDDESYSRTGFLFASKIVKNTSNLQIVDPQFKKSLNSFISQCVFYDVYLGAYTLKDLLSSENIWALVSENASPNRAFLLDDRVTLCIDGKNVLGTQWADAIDNTLNKYVNIIMPTYNSGSQGRDNSAMKTLFLSRMATSFNYLTGLSKDATSILQQNLMANTVQSAALNNPELGIQAYALTKASIQKTSGNITTSQMMALWLPPMMGVMECMIYALFPLVIMLSLFTSGEKVLGNYVMAMVWVGIWPVIYAVLNFGFTWIIKSKSTGYGLSYYDINYLNDVQYNMSSLFGYFTLTVPFLAGGILKLGKQGLDSTFTHMSQLVGGSTQSLAMGASSEAVTGNFSLGNTNFDNHSLHNMNGFKHDMNTSYASGAMTTQLGSGSTVTQTSDGVDVLRMSGGTSDLISNLNIRDEISTSASTQSDKSMNATLDDQSSISTNFSSSERSLYDIGNQINTGTSVGDSFSRQTSSGYTQAAAEYAAAVDKFSQDNNLSTQESSRLLRSAYANANAHLDFNTKNQGVGKIAALATGASAGASISAGGRIEGDKSWNTQDGENLSKAQEFLTSNNLNKSFETAFRGIEEKRYNSDSREGQHLTDSMSVSYDKAQLASQSYTTHMQESEGYREVANHSKTQSASANFNANQELMEYIAKQPQYSGEGPMGAVKADSVLRSNPDLRQAYIEQFVQQKTQAGFEKWRLNNIDSNSVSVVGKEYQSNVQDRQNIDETYSNRKKVLANSDLSKSLKSIPISDSLINATRSDQEIIENEINSRQVSIDAKGNETASAVNSRVKDNIDAQSYISKGIQAIKGKSDKLKVEE